MALLLPFPSLMLELPNDSGQQQRRTHKSAYLMRKTYASARLTLVFFILIQSISLLSQAKHKAEIWRNLIKILWTKSGRYAYIKISNPFLLIQFLRSWLSFWIWKDINQIVQTCIFGVTSEWRPLWWRRCRWDLNCCASASFVTFLGWSYQTEKKNRDDRHIYICIYIETERMIFSLF